MSLKTCIFLCTIISIVECCDYAGQCCESSGPLRLDCRTRKLADCKCIYIAGKNFEGYTDNSVGVIQLSDNTLVHFENTLRVVLWTTITNPYNPLYCSQPQVIKVNSFDDAEICGEYCYLLLKNRIEFTMM